VKKLFLSAAMICCCLVSVGFSKEWWQTWDNFPKVPKISAATAKELVTSGQKVIFIYAGYKVSEKLCGSGAIPYTLVPPNANGSRVDLRAIPKDYWILCYCP